jgi:hypothetical protein
MASHELQTLPDAPAQRTVRIGWDAPLATYFIQVLDEDEEGETVAVLWRGTDPHEIPEARTALDLVRPYATVDDGLEEVLIAEAAAEGERFAGRVGTALVGEATLTRVTDPDQAVAILTDLQKPVGHRQPGTGEDQGDVMAPVNAFSNEVVATYSAADFDPYVTAADHVVLDMWAELGADTRTYFMLRVAWETRTASELAARYKYSENSESAGHKSISYADDLTASARGWGATSTKEFSGSTPADVPALRHGAAEAARSLTTSPDDLPLSLTVTMLLYARAITAAADPEPWLYPN